MYRGDVLLSSNHVFTISLPSNGQVKISFPLIYEFNLEFSHYILYFIYVPNFWLYFTPRYFKPKKVEYVHFLHFKAISIGDIVEVTTDLKKELIWPWQI